MSEFVFQNAKVFWQATFKPMWMFRWQIENVKGKWLWLSFILVGHIVTL
jgi:hypothetical protein